MDSIHIVGGKRLEGRIPISGAKNSALTLLPCALLTADKLTLGKNAKLSGDIVVRRLQIDDGASLNGHVRMGDVEQHASGG